MLLDTQYKVLKYRIYLLLERGKGGRKRGEKH